MKKVELVESVRRQTTIASPATIRGYSLTGFQPCTAELLPAPADHGIVFEVAGQPVAVSLENLVVGGPTHTTALTNGNAQVITVEHFLAAVSAMNVDNLLVRFGKLGLPLPDFSAAAYADALAEAGCVELSAFRREYVVRAPFRVEEPDDGRYAEIKPLDGRDGFVAETVTVFDDPIGEMSAHFVSGETDFRRDLAWARSFVPRPLDDAGERWVKVRARYPILPEDPKESPLVVFGKDGFITPLRGPDEPGRHKLVDLLGDLTLAGHRLVGEMKVFKPGHSFNATVARRIREEAGGGS
ncbi:MAG: UDP-3-O-acyl-N-acetylglucosamine deacetylase [Patescibacteria group bacterium]|nr:UDP-3-O-acyl-N-acetylglucosamine deacetylase [Patescibacteria group bacterium]